MSEKALDNQVGGNHYKDLKIQPVEYILENGLGFLEGNVVKYITRHKAKNGIEDVKKAKHYCEMLIEQYEKEQLLKLGEAIELENTIPQQVIDLEKEAETFRTLPVGSMFFVDDENGIPKKVMVVKGYSCTTCDFNETIHCQNILKRPNCVRMNELAESVQKSVCFKFVKE
jgi:hypothetical protein